FRYRYQPHQRPLVEALTFLGQWWLLVVVSGALVGYLALRGRRRRAAIPAFGAGAVLAVVLLGKLLLVRSNSNVRFGITLGGFPSGHTADATVLVGLCLLSFQPRSRMRLVLLGAALLGAAVGWSRVHIGAHAVAEVIGGWLLGLVVLCLCGAWWRAGGSPELQANTE